MKPDKKYIEAIQMAVEGELEEFKAELIKIRELRERHKKFCLECAEKREKGGASYNEWMTKSVYDQGRIDCINEILYLL